jgi:hypothetical protein
MTMAPTSDRSIKALRGEIATAPDPQILRIVAAVDAMSTRGQADALIAPLRHRLVVLRPARPLRFTRLLFSPLDPLIVPAQRWRPGDDSIPVTALPVMADHVRRGMGERATAIDREAAGHTDAETDTVIDLGRSLWPDAARLFRTGGVPETWEKTGLGIAVYRPLGDCVAALLDEAVLLATVCAETANGLIPVNAEAVAGMLDRVAAVNLAALPLLIALLLVRVPETAPLIATMPGGAKATQIRAALDQAVERLLWQLNVDGGTEDRIAAGSLSDAGAATSQIKTLLSNLDGSTNKPQRREQLRTIRQRLDASCKDRFTAGLEQDLLSPLQSLDQSPDHATMLRLETAARSLRVLELEARTVGSGSTYDLLLRRASEVIKGSAAGGHLALVDQIRLVELLAGPEAALAMMAKAR